jgi:hypothetical protein
VLEPVAAPSKLLCKLEEQTAVTSAGTVSNTFYIVSDTPALPCSAAVAYVKEKQMQQLKQDIPDIQIIGTVEALVLSAAAAAAAGAAAALNEVRAAVTASLTLLKAQLKRGSDPAYYFARCDHLDSLMQAAAGKHASLRQLQSLQQVLAWLLQLPAGPVREDVLDVFRQL